MSSSSQVPYNFARRHGVLIKHIASEHTEIIHKHSLNPIILSELRRYTGKPLQLEAVGKDQFDKILNESFESGTNQAVQVMEDLGEDLDLNHVASSLAEPEDLLDSQDDAPIIRLINALFTEAIKDNASDIHVEPYENKLVVRFRIDGVLQEILQPPYQLAPLISSRIKVMAHLDIAEKRIPQDGRISIKIAGRPIDIRVSTLPSQHGERVVLRLLDNQSGRLDLAQLGMEQECLTQLDKLIHKPHGIILVTGPTGSGKTTTLYAGLTRLNDQTRNIVTIEDPIEYYLDGVGQTQVNTKIKMSFARGLRAILRQDPDVVMIGEIRDLETAQIAIQASLTGHLVLSTLHTNNAISTITRLRDMGIEPFLLSSSLLGVLAQRLVRLLCSHCKIEYTASDSDCQILGLSPSQTQDQDQNYPPTLYRNNGCEHCRQSGYHGRTGLYEFVPIDNTMRTLIHDQKDELTLTKHARTVSKSIRDDGIRRVLSGHTTIDELVRITLDA